MSNKPPFDYSSVGADDVAVALQQHAAEIVGLVGTSSFHMIQIGERLQFAKDSIEYGLFLEWVESETTISSRTAQRYLAVARLAFGRCDTVSLLPPSTVRMLAAKATPPEIVENVLARAASGNILAESAVRAMISDDRDSKKQAKREAEAETPRAQAKRVRAKKTTEKEIWRAEQEQKRLAVRAQAQAIIDRFSSGDVSFLAGTLASDAYDVCDEFLKLIKGDTA